MSSKQMYTIHVVTRKPNLPQGYSLQNMADDYARMIKEEFNNPIDIIGVSTGGSIALHFAASYPQLVRRLIIHSSTYRLGDEAKVAQMQIAKFAGQGKWRAAHATLFDFIVPRDGVMKFLTKPVIGLGWLFGGFILGKPDNPSDLVVTIEAEDEHDFASRLNEIKAPTLVVGGKEDPFYSPALFQQTADGIPNAQLILYEKMRHPASGSQFGEDVLAFLQSTEIHLN